MKIAFFSTKRYDREHFDLHLPDYIQIHYFEVSLNADTANLSKGYDGVCVFVNDVVDKETFGILVNNGIKLVALRCAGFNNVDLEEADRSGIKVVRVPAYSPEAVAEHALALILTLNRKTHKAYNRVRESNFSIEGLTGFNLNKKTVGVIGTGKIGAVFCRIMMGLGCGVVAFDPNPIEALVEAGVKYLSLEELFENSDILSLHCPLIKQTRHIINQQALSRMKDGVMIINTSRGQLVDTKQVIQGLKSGKIGYLGIDVYEQEEGIFFRDLSGLVMQDDVISRLMTFPNVLITGHQGFLTHEALNEIAITTIKNFNAFKNGEELSNEVKIME